LDVSLKNYSYVMQMVSGSTKFKYVQAATAYSVDFRHRFV
jgi:hypothetical protein